MWAQLFAQLIEGGLSRRKPFSMLHAYNGVFTLVSGFFGGASAPV
jgi:hypothetical protein